MAWTANPLDLKASYPTLRHLESYEAILKFLNHEDAVNGVLSAIAKDSKSCSTPDEFNDYLSDKEQQMGFNGNVQSVQDFLRPQQFLTYVQAGIPIIDVGAGKQHGFVTHRVQMVMLHYAFEDQLPVKIVDLYKNLANPNAWLLHDAPQQTPAAKFFKNQENPEDMFVQNVASKFTLLWDPLLDLVFNGGMNRFAQNACCPEYLHDVLAEQHGLKQKWS